MKILKEEKRSKSDNFQENLVEFRIEKGAFQFATQWYIRDCPVRTELFHLKGVKYRVHSSLLFGTYPTSSRAF